MKVIKLIIIFLILFVYSCKPNYLIINKKNSLLAKHYKEIYFSKKEKKKDTISLNENIVCIVKNETEFAIGRFKNNQRYGKWFFYDKEDEEIECYMIKKYYKNRNKIVFVNGLYNSTSW